MQLHVTLDGAVPVYRQIADGIRTFCVAGELKPGARLPTVRELAGELGVHFNTVAEAYRVLSDEGWLKLERRRGVTVLDREQPADPATTTTQGDGGRLRHLISELRSKGFTKEWIRRELNAALEACTMIRLFSAVMALLPFAVMLVMLQFQGRTRPGVVFGVSLPLERAGSVEVDAAVTRFRRRSLVAYGVCAGLVAAAGLLPNPAVLAGMATVSLVTALTLSVVFWEAERRRLLPERVEMPVTRTARLAPRGSSAGVLLAGWAALLPLAVTAGWLRMHWSAMPPRWAEHWNAAGVADGWGHRTPAGVYGPLLFGVVTVLLAEGVGWMQAFGSGPQAEQRRRMLAPLAVMAWLFAGVAGSLALLPLLQPVTVGQVVGAVLVFSLGIVAVAIWMLYRMRDLSAAQTGYDGTADAMWRAGGLIYVNPQDAAVVVPRRFGMGWTLNFGRPAAWLYLAGVLVLTGLSMAAMAFR